jgi:hypothetical protein
MTSAKPHRSKILMVQRERNCSAWRPRVTTRIHLSINSLFLCILYLPWAESGSTWPQAAAILSSWWVSRRSWGFSLQSPTCVQKSPLSDCTRPRRCQLLLASESNISIPVPLVASLQQAHHLKCTYKYISYKHSVPLHMQMQSIDTKMICIMEKRKRSPL